MPKTIIDFIKTNWIYIYISVIYFIFTWVIFGMSLLAFIVLVNIYVCSIAIALSPVGEIIFRFINNVRRLETKKEKQYLLPIYEEVYREAREHYPTMNEDIELCTIDTMVINGVSIGKRTIAVTKGAINTLSVEEMKGLIAHELGHIALGHTKILLLVTLGNGIFTLFALILRILVYGAEFLSNCFRNIFVSCLMVLTRIITDICVFICFFVIDMILAVNSRANEYKADEFTYTTGYGQNMINFLYIIHDITIVNTPKITEKLKASHPDVPQRIGILEKLIDDQKQ